MPLASTAAHCGVVSRVRRMCHLEFGRVRAKSLKTVRGLNNPGTNGGKSDPARKLDAHVECLTLPPPRRLDRRRKLGDRLRWREVKIRRSASADSEWVTPFWESGAARILSGKLYRGPGNAPPRRDGVRIDNSGRFEVEVGPKCVNNHRFGRRTASRHTPVSRPFRLQTWKSG
jgi:hypothetical protein